MIVRPACAEDRAQWEPLWAAYNLFYERPDLPSEITEAVVMETLVDWVRDQVSLTRALKRRTNLLLDGARNGA